MALIPTLGLLLLLAGCGGLFAYGVRKDNDILACVGLALSVLAALLGLWHLT